MEWPHAKEQTNLSDIAGRVEANGNVLVVKLVSVQVEKVHQEVTEVTARVHSPALHFGHHLEHAHDEANDREATDSAIHRFIETSHQQEMLDQSHQRRHSRIHVFPGQKRFNSSDSRAVLERDVNLEACFLVNKLGQWDFSSRNDFDIIFPSQSFSQKKVLELPEMLLQVVFRRPAVQVAVGYHDHVHVTSWEVEARWKRAKRLHVRVTPVSATE